LAFGGRGGKLGGRQPSEQNQKKIDPDVGKINQLVRSGRKGGGSSFLGRLRSVSKSNVRGCIGSTGFVLRGDGRYLIR